MFKKQFKVSNSHALAGKDKKKIKETLLKQGFDPASVDAFLDDKLYDGQELFTDKLQGSKVQVLTRNKIPMMFTSEGGKSGTSYLPSIYLLFQLEHMPNLRVYLKEGVEQYIFNGADLMWPGIKRLSSEEFKQYDVAVIYCKNRGGEEDSWVPIAVGKVLTGKVPDELKGKAVQVEHYLYDELWNTGNKKIPEEIKVALTQQILPPDLSEESKEESDITTETTPTIEQPEEEKKGDTVEGSVSEESQQLKPSLTPEEVDLRLIEAFYRCLMESIKEAEMLPMEPSDFQKDHLALFNASDNSKLDFRMSTFKRIGKLLEVMQKKGVIEYAEPKNISHKLITKVNRENEEFKNYVPQYSLKKIKKATPLASGVETSELGYPRVHIEEIYEPTKHLKAILSQIKGTPLQPYYSIKDCKELLTVYIKQNELDLRKGMIKVDPYLNMMVSKNHLNSDNEVTKDVLLKNVPTHLSECYQVTQLDQQELIKTRVRSFKGPVPHVLLKAQRVQNKKQTIIQHLELFQIDYDELVPFLAHKCAGSCTLAEPLEGAKKDCYTVQVQGEHLDTITEVLTKKYKVPMKYIDVVNNIQSKKKKQQY